MSKDNHTTKESKAEYQRRWRKEHPGYYSVHKAKDPEYMKKYREANREKAKLAAKAWREKHPEMVRFHRSMRRARLRDARISETRIRKEEIHNWFSRICPLCGLPIEDQYHIDHIMPLSKGGAHEVTNLQLAHPFCNQSKFNRYDTILI